MLEVGEVFHPLTSTASALVELSFSSDPGIQTSDTPCASVTTVILEEDWRITQNEIIPQNGFVNHCNLVLDALRIWMVMRIRKWRAVDIVNNH